MDELLPVELTLLLPGLGGRAAPHIKSSCQLLLSSSNPELSNCKIFPLLFQPISIQSYLAKYSVI